MLGTQILALLLPVAFDSHQSSSFATSAACAENDIRFNPPHYHWRNDLAAKVDLNQCI